MTRVEIMGRAKFVRQGSKMVFVFDLANLDTDDALQVMNRGEDVIRRMPKRSVLTLVGISDNKHDISLKKFAVKLASDNSSQISKVAFCGVPENSIMKEWSAMMSSIGHNFKAFQHTIDAVSWLTESG